MQAPKSEIGKAVEVMHALVRKYESNKTENKRLYDAAKELSKITNGWMVNDPSYYTHIVEEAKKEDQNNKEMANQIRESVRMLIERDINVLNKRWTGDKFETEEDKKLSNSMKESLIKRYSNLLKEIA